MSTVMGVRVPASLTATNPSCSATRIMAIATGPDRGDDATLVTFNPQRLGNQSVILDDHRLQIQADIRHIFNDARDRGEFVLDSLNLDPGHGTAFQAGQQNSAQTVADRGTETAFERFDHELAVSAAERFLFGDEDQA